MRFSSLGGKLSLGEERGPSHLDARLDAYCDRNDISFVILLIQDGVPKREDRRKGFLFRTTTLWRIYAT